MKASIFLLTPVHANVGGAEKRFFGLWLELQRRGFACRLVTHQPMLDVLLATNEFAGLEQYRDQVVVLKGNVTRPAEMREAFRRFCRESMEPDEIAHFVMAFPSFSGSRNPMLFSDPAASLKYFNWKGKLLTWLAIAGADTADILDPERADRLRRIFFWNRSKIQVTSNTFVDPSLYQPLPMEEKQNWLVFLGRFEEVKQSEEFVRSIPAISSRLRELGVTLPKFFVLGAGSIEERMREILSGDEYRDVEIQFGYDPKPNEVLKKAKVFFSLQKDTNYPSKSLAEALACGCIPVVSDNGSTRMMARPEFSYFVPEQFSEAELAERVTTIFVLPAAEIDAKSRAAVEFARSELSIGRMTDYYVGLYRSLAK